MSSPLLLCHHMNTNILSFNRKNVFIIQAKTKIVQICMCDYDPARKVIAQRIAELHNSEKHK